MKLRSLFLYSLVFFCLVSCKQQVKESQETEAFVIGSIEHLYSQVLQEDRALNVYLPDGYDKNMKYPVIYLLDGSADEDFIHVVGIVQHYTFSWVDVLPQSIVVGIANNNRKKDFTSPSHNDTDKKLIPINGGSDKFISFIEEELQPYIEAKFKTTDSKTIIGQSLGGLLATEILFTKPQLFDKYILISPSLWWRDSYLLNEELVTSNKPISVYIGVGTEGNIAEGHKTMEEEAELLADKLKSLENESLTIYFDHLADEDHATVGHQAVLNAFKKFHIGSHSK